ncbi:MAG: hypothetical protein C4291_07985 [Candidatus Dadabacteria bacterium]
MNNPHTDYDIIIVGAGPAGGMCAYELSKRKFNILIIEKEKLPRYKVCAGGLTKKAVDILPNDLHTLAENYTYNIHLTLNHDRGFSKEVSFPIVTMVMRDRFDYFLVQKSICNDARILDGTKVNSIEEFPDYVIVRTEKGDFKSKVVVGADGANSLVARSVGLRKKPRLGVALEGEAFPDDNGSIHIDFNVIPRGYGWIFPKKDHLSVGVFTTLPKIKEIKKYFSIYFEKKGLSMRYRCRSILGHQIPIGGRSETLNTKRGLLIGDAAGLADPITGEGIYFGLRSGQMAAEVIAESLSGNHSGLDRYTRMVNNEIINDLRYATYIAMFFYKLTPIIYDLGIKKNLISEDLIKALVSGHPYRDIFIKIPRKIFNLLIPIKINY